MAKRRKRTVPSSAPPIRDSRSSASRWSVMATKAVEAATASKRRVALNPNR